MFNYQVKSSIKEQRKETMIPNSNFIVVLFIILIMIKWKVNMNLLIQVNKITIEKFIRDYFKIIKVKILLLIKVKIKKLKIRKLKMIPPTINQYIIDW
jgi:hypothetical protein